MTDFKQARNSQSQNSGVVSTSFSTPTKVSVGNTTTVVSAAKEIRLFLLLQNDSDEDIYVNFGEDAVLNDGLRIEAGGGGIVFDSVVPTNAINAICASGTKDLLIVEA